MKVNKAIYLKFFTSSKATANINVNFPVKSIHVKSACFTASTPIVPGFELYYTLTSDLSNGEPLAQVYNSSTYSASQFCDVSFQPYKPIIVNGTYTFTLYQPDGTPQPTLSNDYLSIILEFNGEDENNH